MSNRGFAQSQIILGIIGIIILGGLVFGTDLLRPQESNVPVAIEDGNGADNETPTDTPTQEPGDTPPATNQTPSPLPTPPVTEQPQEDTQTPPQETPSETPTDPGTTTPQEPTQPEPTPDPTPEPYNPGFMAASRVHPGIPSENERETLPTCDGRSFTVNPINLGVVTSIDATGQYYSDTPQSSALVNLPTSSDDEEYDLTAPADIWITHVAIETDITADAQDSTVYFALCRDIFGYFNHIKELTDDMQKIVTDTTCFNKPHVGENACYAESLKLVARGSLIGKVGQIEGQFGMNIIDLRQERGLTNASQYSIFTNFATCPFDLYPSPSGYYNKLSGNTTLCSI